MRSVVDIQKRWATVFEGAIGVDLRTSVRDGDGIDPCETGLRSVCWKSFLLYGPVSQSTWPKKLAESRSVYVSLRNHYLKLIDHPDHLYSTADPLADDETSPWSTLRQDEEARAEIFQDVTRTYQDNFFFKEPETQRKLLDILFIFSKLNPDTGYRQGMHELLGTLLWAISEDAVDASSVLAADREKDGARLMMDTLSSEWVEADSFTLFCAVMQNVKSSYETGENRDSSPIIDRSRKIHEELLATYDPELALRLQVIGVLPQIYAIRWIRLLFGREFEFKETLRLWDILFAENIPASIVDLTCVALLLRMRWSLIDADYSTAITNLTRVSILSGDQDPRSLVRDALMLGRNQSQEAGADLIQASSGRRPKTLRYEGIAKDRLNTDEWPARAFRTPQGRHSASPSPARFSSPHRQLENLFQNVSSGIQQRTEGWTVSRAVRSAVGEVRKNVNNFQAHSRQASTDVAWTGSGPGQNQEALAPSEMKQLQRKVDQLEARNKALAKMLDGALESLRSMNERNGGDKDKREEHFNVSLAKIQFVSVYLSDSEIPIPGDVADAERQTGQATKVEEQTGQATKVEGQTGQATKVEDQTGQATKDAPDRERASGENAQARPRPASVAPTAEKETEEGDGPGQRHDQGPGQNAGGKAASPRDKAGGHHLRPSLADSSFSFMLGEDRHISSFVTSASDLPEQRRDSRGGESRAGPKQLWAEQQQKEAAKDQQRRASEDHGFTMSSLRRGNRRGHSNPTGRRLPNLQHDTTRTCLLLTATSGSPGSPADPAPVPRPRHGLSNGYNGTSLRQHWALSNARLRGALGPSSLSTSPAVDSSSPLTSPDLVIRIPKNRSTGNLLAAPFTTESASLSRSRFSFNAGAPAQEMSNLKRASRLDHEYGPGISGLQRIRRPHGPQQTAAFAADGQEWASPPLLHAATMPLSRSSSRSASAVALMSGPSSPVLEDLRRFPAESLHSFSFARRSEDYLSSQQNILQKSVDFLRHKSAWAANPRLAKAQAHMRGDEDVANMMELLKKAQGVGAPDNGDQRVEGLGIDADDEANVDANVEANDDDDGQVLLSPPSVASTPLPWSDDVLRRLSAPSAQVPDLEIDQPASSDGDSASRRGRLKRTYTDLTSLTLQEKLQEALAQPYSSHDSAFVSTAPHQLTPAVPSFQAAAGSAAVHTHSGKSSPPAQAVFRTDADSPWTILAANDIACLIFGVTRAEVRSLSILGIIEEHRRQWLEERLARASEPERKQEAEKQSSGARLLSSGKAGITARLLSGCPRQTSKNHAPTRSRGVLLCGDVLPIQKRNGTIGAASFWVMEKHGGLIWVVEEINEDVAHLALDHQCCVASSRGRCQAIWGRPVPQGTPLASLVPGLTADFFEPLAPARTRPILGHFSSRTVDGMSVPCSVSVNVQRSEVRVASLPHIAGMMVLKPGDLTITSANSVFSAALFGYEQPSGLSIRTLIPTFQDLLSVLCEHDDVQLTDGLVVPEHSFRRARALLALRGGGETMASIFLRPTGLPAKHRDGSDIMVDVQMRVVPSESVFPARQDALQANDGGEADAHARLAVSELVYAVWITYSRHLHAVGSGVPELRTSQSERPLTPPVQPQPPEHIPSPPIVESGESGESGESKDGSALSLLSPQVTNASMDEPLEHPPPHVAYTPHEKKTIRDFVILEELGTGAYGQVKLGRYRKSKSKVVIKYITKKRILVDTWTRDRRLGTIPLEIHVMDYLRRDGLRHPNIVEMIDFFEDDVNYYIETYPIGMPGIDLFDYIELRANMDEDECMSIFRQVADAIHHLHTKARVVHRDIKDENVVLDGEGQIKLIDFGSAAYIKNGPFDVFVGTLGKYTDADAVDYAAPEVLQGKPYGGQEQDIWALGILLYTIVYKENPFYNLDEILDRELRVPYIPYSELCIDLIRKMLDRDVEQRITIEQVKDHPWLAED
ncbi:hypothetical protein DV737_g4183, partial [Chaetothyriales sp. CBS 132003]